MGDALENLKGVFPAMVTPADNSGSIDAGAVREAVEFFIDRGVDGLYILGTSGEALMLTQEEKLKLAAMVMKCVDGRVPVMVHVGMLPVGECCELARAVQREGAKFLSAIPPYYFPFGEADIRRYYERILECLGEESRLFLYHIPAYARNSVSPELLKALMRSGKIGGIKDSGGDLERTRRFREVLGQQGRLFIGCDEQISDALELGADGIISGNANVVPELFVGLHRAWKEGKREEAGALQKLVNELAEATENGNIPLLKRGLCLRGVDVNSCTEPYVGRIEEKRGKKLGRAVDLALRRLG